MANRVDPGRTDVNGRLSVRWTFPAAGTHTIAVNHDPFPPAPWTMRNVPGKPIQTGEGTEDACPTITFHPGVSGFANEDVSRLLDC